MALKYKIVFEPGITGVMFTGNIDERTGSVLTEIRSQVKTPRVVFNMAKVNLINSIGIATWIAHLKAFDDIELAYVQMPYTFVSLCKIIPQLHAGRIVASFQVRYECAQCHDDDFELRLVSREETLKAGGFSVLACPRCKGPMRVDPSDDELIELFLP